MNNYDDWFDMEQYEDIESTENTNVKTVSNTYGEDEYWDTIYMISAR